MRRVLPSALLAASLALAGCGDGPEETTRVAGDVLTVHVSLPLHGVDAAAGRAAELGMRRALVAAGGRAGDRAVRLVVASSTRREDEVWDPGTIEANARRTVEDPTAIAYLGELDRGGSAVSLPVTNGAGILQVALADGLTSLTRTPPGRPRAGPERYYPGDFPTFVRLVPPDLEAARAIVAELRDSGARRLAVLHGDGIADRELEAIVLTLLGEGMPRTVLRASAGDGEPDEVAELVEEIAAARPDALLYAGPGDSTADAVLGALAARLPLLDVHGGPPLARGAGRGALPAAGCALTAVPAVDGFTPRGRRLLATLRAQSGDPELGGEAVLGYEAMRLVLAAIDAAGPDRRGVATAARRSTAADGLLGPYRFDRHGDVEDRPPVCLGLADGRASVPSGGQP